MKDTTKQKISVAEKNREVAKQILKERPHLAGRLSVDELADLYEAFTRSKADKQDKHHEETGF